MNKRRSSKPSSVPRPGNRAERHFARWILELLLRESHREESWLLEQIRIEAERRAAAPATPRKGVPEIPRRDLFDAGTGSVHGLDASNKRPPRVGDAAHWTWDDYVDVGTTLGLDDIVLLVLTSRVLDPPVTANAIALHLCGDERLPERLRRLTEQGMRHHVERALDRLRKDKRVRRYKDKPKGQRLLWVYESTSAS